MVKRVRTGTADDAGLRRSAGPPSDADYRELGRDLREEMLKVTLEEFRLTEMRFETDSRLGRELLFLIANREWVRRTTETIDISRVAAAGTTIVVDADPGYVVHEALRPDQGPIWLPLVSLPPEVPSDEGYVFPAPRGRRRRWPSRARRPPLPPDLPVNIQVTDAAGQRVAELPQAEVRRQLAAALAETLVARINHRAEDRPDRRGAVLGREHQVLMAAAMAQVIATVPDETRPHDDDVTIELRGRSNRLEHLQKGLRDALDAELELIGQSPGRKAHDLPSALASREAQVVHAVRGIMIVVVPVERTQPATSFTVTMPSRRLGRRHTFPGHWSMVDLRIGLLVPSVHSDRVIQVQVPDGVLVPGGGTRGLRVNAQITVAAPQQFEQLCLLTDRLVTMGSADVAWVRKQLAELAVVKLDAVIQALRHHYDLREGHAATDALLDRLWSIRKPFDGLARGGVEHHGDLVEQWASLRPHLADLTWLHRRLERNTASPGSMRFLAHAVDEFTLRADPVEAFVEVSVAPADPPVLDTAWLISFINLLLVTGVTAGLALQAAVGGGSSRAEVLAAILAIFPTIQAARVTHPDPGLLSGLLQVPHFWLGVGTAVPSVFLAAALAFAPEGDGSVRAGLVAIAAQALIHVWIMSQQRRWWRYWHSGVQLFTEYAPDHAGLNAVRTAWCQSLTGEALLIGRTAFSYVVVEKGRPDGLLSLLGEAQGGHPRLTAPVLSHLGGESGIAEPRPDTRRATAADGGSRDGGPRNGGPGDGGSRNGGSGDGGTPSVNLLGALLGAATGQNAMFLVFRDEPTGLDQSTGDGSRMVRRVPLGRGRLVPVEPPTWVLDVMVGIRRDALSRLRVDRHPLTHVADASLDAAFTVLNVRFPAPPPPHDTEERAWLRLRVGVPHRPGASLDALVTFLTSLAELRAADRTVTVHLREVPQMATVDATQTAPEDSFDEVPGKPGVDHHHGRLITDVNVDVLGDDVVPGGDWRLLPVCAPARAGFLSHLLGAVSESDPEVLVAGALQGLFHGITVIFLLCHSRVTGAEPAAEMAGTVVERLRRTDPHAVVPITTAQRRAYVRTQRKPRVLLKVQVRTPDRPGALQHLLMELKGRLCEAVGDDDLGSLDVVYAFTPVVDGHALSGRLVLSLPHHPSGSDDAWGHLPWLEIARVVTRGLAAGADGATGWGAANGTTYDRTTQLSDDTVVTLDVVRAAVAGGAEKSS